MSQYSINHHHVVSTIIGLLLAGLVIDLGGGPNHDRIGFRASTPPNEHRVKWLTFCSTGRTLEPLAGPA